jgi:histidinol-phosphate aminotransferase
VAALTRIADPGSEQYGLVRLNRNERIDPLPGWFVSRIRDAIGDQLLTGYPTTDELYEELSASLDLDPRQLLLTAGSDAAVKALYQAFVEPGDRVVALDPSYAMYRVYAEMFRARMTPVPIQPDLTVDPQRLLESIDAGVRLVILANPNQPTGTLTEDSVLLDVLERAAGVGALVAIDEAYYPFSHSTLLPHIDRFPHLLILRTFSKAAGLAGVRIGYAAGHPDVVHSLWKMRSAHDVNSFAILCAREILRVPELVDEYVQQVEAGKRVLAEAAIGLGLEPIAAPTNFMLIRVAPRYEPEAVVDALADLGYLVRGPFRADCISDCIRVTLGAPPVMSEFADALGEALKQAAAPTAS